MGKKKRGGVLWSQDISSGSPLGQDVRQWDGLSRTTKRTQKRDEISQRREQVVKASALKEEELAYAVQAIKETWAQLNEYSREIVEEDLDHLINIYLTKRTNYKELFLLIDSRHGIKPIDESISDSLIVKTNKKINILAIWPSKGPPYRPRVPKDLPTRPE